MVTGESSKGEEKHNEIRLENEAWARFLYKQYKKKKFRESLSKQQESVE